MSRTSDRRYQANRAKLKKPGVICVLCGQPIDIDLPQYHPKSFSTDHIDPVGLGGDNRGPLVPMHLVCNQQRGVKPLELVRQDTHSRRHY